MRRAVFALVCLDIVVVGSGVRDVFLAHGREVEDRVGEAVSAAEGDDDARVCGAVVERDVAARVGEEGAGVPGCDELKGGEVGAAGETGEGLCETKVGGVYAVGYVY